jgi:uncharacterized membrane protein
LVKEEEKKTNLSDRNQDNQIKKEKKALVKQISHRIYAICIETAVYLEGKSIPSSN